MLTYQVAALTQRSASIKDVLTRSQLTGIATDLVAVPGIVVVSCLAAARREERRGLTQMWTSGSTTDREFDLSALRDLAAVLASDRAGAGSTRSDRAWRLGSVGRWRCMADRRRCASGLAFIARLIESTAHGPGRRSVQSNFTSRSDTRSELRLRICRRDRTRRYLAPIPTGEPQCVEAASQRISLGTHPTPW